jgi:hypothetical protein
MNIYNSTKKEVRRYNLISLSLILLLNLITIISIGVGLFDAPSIGPVVFAQTTNTNTNSILDGYTYDCIKFNETIESGIPVYKNQDFLNTQEICNMLLQGMGSLDKQAILQKYEG